MDLPRGPFSVIYADPPWRFASWSHRGEAKGAVQHYDCMSLDDICALPVAGAAARDAALFIWVVQPMLPEALRVIEAWGFTFKTVAFCWVKLKGVAAQQKLFYAAEDVRLGLGYHTRSGMEQCWLATRGEAAAPLPGTQPETVYRERKGRHSAKPDWFAGQIERLFPGVARIELFARAARPGWDVWGFESDSSAQKPEAAE